MEEITLIIDPFSGEVVVENNSALSPGALSFLKESLGQPKEIACARPLVKLPVPAADLVEPEEITARIAGYYHNSLTEGPGRRSSVLFQSCPLKCPGFIYSLKWGKYYITYDRTEPTTYCNRFASRTMAQAFS